MDEHLRIACTAMACLRHSAILELEVAHLLDTGNMSRDILDRNRVFNSQAMALALYPGLVNENPAIGGEALTNIQFLST